MKAETQVVHLEKMMQKHHRYSEYELTMPLVEVKKSMLKNLAVDDVLLVGFEQLEMLLFQEEMLCASAVINLSLIHI